MEKAEQKLQRSAGIIADYKQVCRVYKIDSYYYLLLLFSLIMLKAQYLAQICSQLTNRLERQQAAHREEMDTVKVRVALLSSLLLL